MKLNHFADVLVVKELKTCIQNNSLMVGGRNEKKTYKFELFGKLEKHLSHFS